MQPDGLVIYPFQKLLWLFVVNMSDLRATAVYVQMAKHAQRTPYVR